MAELTHAKDLQARFTVLSAWIYGPLTEDAPMPTACNQRMEWEYIERIDRLMGEVELWKRQCEQDNRSQRENTALNHENATLKDINLKQVMDLLDANTAWASECEEVSALKVQAKRIDRVLDEEGVARSCINPLEDLRIAVRGLKQERDTYKEQAKALKAQVERLIAPATDEEWDQFNVTLDPGGEPLILRSRFNRIIAARAAALQPIQRRKR